MKIKVTSIYVDDQEKALRFYTDVLGLVKKTDVTQGPYRWLTVASPEEPANPSHRLDYRHGERHLRQPDSGRRAQPLAVNVSTRLPEV